MSSFQARCFVSLESSRETLRFSRNKIHCSPRDQSLNVKYLIDVWDACGDTLDYRLVCHFFVLATSSVIYYWTDARQHGISLWNRHECFTGKYTLLKFIRNYIWDPRGVFSIIQLAKILMTSFPTFSQLFANSQLVYMVILVIISDYESAFDSAP